MGVSRGDSIGLSFTDPFSGAGGSSAGFCAAGHEPVFALDKDGDSCVSYERNFALAPEHASMTDFNSFKLAGKTNNVILDGPR